MNEERVHRRLAAVLPAAVVGYSWQMELYEAGTLAALKALHIAPGSPNGYPERRI